MHWCIKWLYVDCTKRLRRNGDKGGELVTNWRFRFCQWLSFPPLLPNNDGAAFNGCGLHSLYMRSSSEHAWGGGTARDGHWFATGWWGQATQLPSLMLPPSPLPPSSPQSSMLSSPPPLLMQCPCPCRCFCRCSSYFVAPVLAAVALAVVLVAVAAVAIAMIPPCCCRVALTLATAVAADLATALATISCHVSPALAALTVVLPTTTLPLLLLTSLLLLIFWLIAMFLQLLTLLLVFALSCCRWYWCWLLVAFCQHILIVSLFSWYSDKKLACQHVGPTSKQNLSSQLHSMLPMRWTNMADMLGHDGLANMLACLLFGGGKSNTQHPTLPA